MKPTLVLLHGLLSDERMWQPVAERLRGRADIRIPNLCTQDGMLQMAQDAWAAAADVPADVPVVLAGFSMGGYVAIQMLVDAPRPVAALALVDTSTRPEAAKNMPAREAMIAALQRDFGAETLTLLRSSVHPDRLSDVMLMLTSQRIINELGVDVAERQLRAIFGRADHRAMLAQIRMPTLVLCGAVDRIVPLWLSREAAALIPGARLHIVQDAGHFTPMEQPDEVATQLARLLDQVR